MNSFINIFCFYKVFLIQHDINKGWKMDGGGGEDAVSWIQIFQL